MVITKESDQMCVRSCLVILVNKLDDDDYKSIADNHLLDHMFSRYQSTMIFFTLLVVILMYSLAEGNAHWPGQRNHDFSWDAHTNPLAYGNQQLPSSDYSHISILRPELSTNNQNAQFEQFYYPTKHSMTNAEVANLVVDPKTTEHKWPGFSEVEANENELDGVNKHLCHRHHRFHGLKGEINIKWMVKPFRDFKSKTTRDVRSSQLSLPLMSRLRSLLSPRGISSAGI